MLTIADSESKLQAFPQEVVKENEKKGMDINWKNREWLHMSRRKRPACKLQIGDRKLNKFEVLNIREVFQQRTERATLKSKDALGQRKLPSKR